jgi:hypothetical protein
VGAYVNKCGALDLTIKQTAGNTAAPSTVTTAQTGDLVRIYTSTVDETLVPVDSTSCSLSYCDWK